MPCVNFGGSDFQGFRILAEKEQQQSNLTERKPHVKFFLFGYIMHSDKIRKL